MWIFTPQGFVSAVAHKDDSSQIVVRARDSLHLRSLFPAERIITMRLADYPYRVHIPRQAFTDWLTTLGEGLDYPDFKSTIPAGDTTYREACHDVWSIMHVLQHRPIEQ